MIPYISESVGYKVNIFFISFTPKQRSSPWCFLFNRNTYTLLTIFCADCVQVSNGPYLVTGTFLQNLGAYYRFLQQFRASTRSLKPLYFTRSTCCMWLTSVQKHLETRLKNIAIVNFNDAQFWNDIGIKGAKQKQRSDTCQQTRTIALMIVAMSRTKTQEIVA